MKAKIFFIVALGLFGAQIHAEDKAPATELTLKDQKEKASYSIGFEIGEGMKQQKLDIDPDLIIRGLRDGISGKDGLLSHQEMSAVMEIFEKDIEARRQKELVELPEKNRKEGATFLEENKKKEGIKILEVKMPDGKISELQYQVIREGTGATPKLGDRVSTHYRGTLLDGTEFDSSYSRNAPTSFGLRQVIKGWQEALQLMKVGSKWQLFIPSELAYSDKGAGRTIGPNATLIFDIELLAIEKQ